MSLRLTHLHRKRRGKVPALVTGLTVVAAIALTAPSATAAPGQATQPARPGSPAGARHARPAVMHDQHAGGRLISAAQRAFDDSPTGKALQSGEKSAQASAVATGTPATVAAATTPYSLLTAQPDGTFRQVTTLQPARYELAGRWVDISTTLHRIPGGIAPVSVPGTVVLSSGGAGPAATITLPSGARTQLSVPYTLSAPVVNGPTATYRTSVPGLSLTLTVTSQGGVSEAVTRPAASGARPGSVTVAVAAAANAAAGTWTQSSAARAGFRFAAPATITAPASVGRVIGTGHAMGAAGVNAVSGSAHSAVVRLATQTASSMTPDSIPGCSNVAGSACDHGPAYAAATEAFKTTPMESAATLDNYGYDDGNPNGETSGLPIGNEGVYGFNCSSVCADRAYFQFQLTSLNSNMYISTSNLYENLIWSSDWGCSDHWPAQLWWTAGIGSGTDWNSQPGHEQSSATGTDLSIPVGYNASSGCSTDTSVSPHKPIDQSFSFNVYTPVNNSYTAGHVAFGIYGDEGNSGDPSGNTVGECVGGVGSINGLAKGDSSTGAVGGYNCGFSLISTDPEIITTYDLTPPEADSYSITGPQAIDKPGTSDNGCNTNTPYVAATSATLGAKVYSGLSGEQAAGVFSTSDYNGKNVSGANGEYPQDSSGAVAPVASGTNVTVKATGLVNGDYYSYYVASETDGIPWGKNGTNVGKVQGSALICDFAVDTTAPADPLVLNVAPNYDSTAKDISSVTLTVMDEEKAPTGCGFSPCFDSGIYQYDYSTDGTTLTGTASAIGYNSTGQYQTGPYTAGYPSATGTTGAPLVNGSVASLPLCLDDKHSGTTAGTIIDIYGCNGTGAQKWNYNWSDGLLEVGSMCAATAGGATTSGTLVELEACDQRAGEWWTQGTNGSLVDSNSGLCLNAPATTDSTQLTVATCNGKAAQDWGNTYATITVPATSWGVNTVYLKAETTAGVSSANYATFSYYVPFSGTATLGDVTGDGYPDLLATGSDGNLYACTGASNATEPTNSCSTVVGTPATSPGATTSSPVGWNNFTITHRGSDTGVITDNLYAYNPAQGAGTPPVGVLSEYTDSDNTAGLYPTTVPYENTSNITTVVDPDSSGGSSLFWARQGTTQLLAIGNPLASSTASVTSAAPGLLAIENGNLWYYSSNGGGSLNPGIELGTGWGGMTLIAPGFTSQDHQQEVWAVDASGNLFAYHFHSVGGQPYLSTSTTPISPEDGTNNFAITVPTLPAGFTLAHGSTSCPSIASAGDGNGGYIHPALYTLCTVNGVQKILDIFININPTGTSSNPDVNDLNQGTPVQITPSLPAGVTLTQIS